MNLHIELVHKSNFAKGIGKLEGGFRHYFGMCRSALFVGSFLAWIPASAQNSYVLANGVSRAPGVTLHCATGLGTASPCGVTSQPLVVGPIPGASTSANQASEINLQQNVTQALGAPNDPVYANGPGSMISLLKGVTAELASGIQALPTGGQPVSRSLGTVPGMASTSLFQINPARHYMAFQAPQTSFLWVNFVGGVAGPNLPDCVYFPAGTFYESGSYVNRGSVSVYSPVPTSITAWEG